MAKVKICGLTNLDDALAAEELGADYLGFIFFTKSPRRIYHEKALDIIVNLKGRAKKVGLFYNQEIEFVKKTAGMCRLDLCQLHGDESPEYVDQFKGEFGVIKSFKIKEGFDFSILEKYKNADYFLFDTFKEGVPGGTGTAFDWDLIAGREFIKPIFLAGGLKPGNVREAAAKINPFAVDVASGVEISPGVKDHKLLAEFINAAKN